jgi:hypothetical protein
MKQEELVAYLILKPPVRQGQMAPAKVTDKLLLKTCGLNTDVVRQMRQIPTQMLLPVVAGTVLDLLKRQCLIVPTEGLSLSTLFLNTSVVRQGQRTC